MLKNNNAGSCSISMPERPMRCSFAAKYIEFVVTILSFNVGEMSRKSGFFHQKKRLKHGF